MNVVMTESGRFLEVQGTAEGMSFSRGELDELLGLAAAVHACGVEEVDARLDRGVEHGNGAVVVDTHAEVVAAETGHRHPQP